MILSSFFYHSDVEIVIKRVQLLLRVSKLKSILRVLDLVVPVVQLFQHLEVLSLKNQLSFYYVLQLLFE